MEKKIEIRKENKINKVHHFNSDTLLFLADIWLSKLIVYVFFLGTETKK